MVGEGGERGVAQVGLQMRPDAGDERHVMRLAVAQAEPGEDAENAQVALGTEPVERGGEALCIRAGGGDVMGEHRVGSGGRDIAARVLQQRLMARVSAFGLRSQ